MTREQAIEKLYDLSEFAYHYGEIKEYTNEELYDLMHCEYDNIELELIELMK